LNQDNSITKECFETKLSLWLGVLVTFGRPVKHRTNGSFAILVGPESVFDGVTVLKKSNSKNPKAKVVKRVSHLDLSIVRQFAPERIVFRNELLAYEEQTNRRMIECLKTIFFSGTRQYWAPPITGSSLRMMTILLLAAVKAMTCSID